MEVRFRGRYEAKADQKGRLLLPAGIRQILPGVDQPLVITNSQVQGRPCLDAFPGAEWEQLEERVARMPQLRSEVQAFQRFYLAGAHRLTLDNHNRLLLPGGLRKYAQIESEVVLVGMGNKFEVWSAQIWIALHKKLAHDFEQTLAQVACLEVAL